jgi:excisionase family DNA binding protein
MERDKPAPRYLKAVDIAQRFGVTRKTVFAWVAQGIVPYYKVGRLVFFAPADIESMLERNRYVGQHRMPIMG